jgi:glycosyltransferase involved in cell wall biosynthesis
LGVTSGITLESKFLSVDDAVLRLYAEVDLIVLPYIGSDPTGSSASLRVALASGRPTLVTEQPCFRDVEDEVIKFKWSSSEALAELIDIVLKDRARQEYVVHKALARVQEETWSHVAQRYLQLFREATLQQDHPILV